MKFMLFFSPSFLFGNHLKTILINFRFSVIATDLHIVHPLQILGVMGDRLPLCHDLPILLIHLLSLLHLALGQVTSR